MEHETRFEISPETLEEARAVLHDFEFGDYADKVISYGGKQMTIVEGLARHWDAALDMDEVDLVRTITSYVEMAKVQSGDT